MDDPKCPLNDNCILPIGHIGYRPCEIKDKNISAQHYTQVKDSGERRTFSTGSVRDKRDGKGRFDLIPALPHKRVAVHYENGANKYGDRNWEKGQPMSSYLDSLLRHANVYLAGDRSEDHLAAIAWNAYAMMHTEEMCRIGKLPQELLDLPEAIV